LAVSRTLAACLILAACLALAGPAHAEPWDLPARPSSLPRPRSATLPVPPGFAASLADGGAMAPLAAFFRGLSLLDSGAPVQAAQAAEAFAAVAAHPLAGFLARDALLLAGYAREAAGDPAGALAAYEGWMAAGPEMILSQTVWLRAGAVAAKVGETRKAGDFLRKLCLTRPWTDEAGDAAALARALFASGGIDWNPDAPQTLLAQAERAVDALRTEAAGRILDRLAAAPGTTIRPGLSTCAARSISRAGAPTRPWPGFGPCASGIRNRPSRRGPPITRPGACGGGPSRNAPRPWSGSGARWRRMRRWRSGPGRSRPGT
jgi:tetratricopeptide (TPR) repeat protein